MKSVVYFKMAEAFGFKPWEVDQLDTKLIEEFAIIGESIIDDMKSKMEK